MQNQAFMPWERLAIPASYAAFFVPKTYVGWLEGGMLMASVLYWFCGLEVASLVLVNPMTEPSRRSPL